MQTIAHIASDYNRDGTLMNENKTYRKKKINRNRIKWRRRSGNKDTLSLGIDDGSLVAVCVVHEMHMGRTWDAHEVHLRCTSATAPNWCNSLCSGPRVLKSAFHFQAQGVSLKKKKKRENENITRMTFQQHRQMHGGKKKKLIIYSCWKINNRREVLFFRLVIREK